MLSKPELLICNLWLPLFSPPFSASHLPPDCRGHCFPLSRSLILTPSLPICVISPFPGDLCSYIYSGHSHVVNAALTSCVTHTRPRLHSMQGGCHLAECCLAGVVSLNNRVLITVFYRRQHHSKNGGEHQSSVEDCTFYGQRLFSQRRGRGYDQAVL